MNQSRKRGAFIFLGFHFVFAFMKREAKAGVANGRRGGQRVSDSGGVFPVVIHRRRWSMITTPITARRHLQPQYGSGALYRN
jgi:hypothetical protein